MNIKEYANKKSLKTIFEIGVGNPNLCRVQDMMGDENFNLHLLEAHPTTYQHLINRYGNYSNLSIYNIAVFNKDGEIFFCDDGDSSYVDEVISPTKHNVPDIAKLKNKFKVPCKSMKSIDNENIDIILIDTEGSEWEIIKNMISRPQLIVLETHNHDDHGHGSYYTPNLSLINEWMINNNYKLLKTDATDSWYEKQ